MGVIVRGAQTLALKELITITIVVVFFSFTCKSLKFAQTGHFVLSVCSDLRYLPVSR